MNKVDLHIHTTASDGKFSPVDIVRKAKDAGLEYIAITDHDSIDGVDRAQVTAKNLIGITVIGGVEINTDIPSGEIHILGYLVDLNDTELTVTLERLRDSRIERARKMVNKLSNMGLKIDFERVKELAGDGSLGRPHIAEAMLEKGYISTLKEAFNKYIGRNGPAYAERDKISPEDATRLILRAHGIPVLAHPLTCEKPEHLISQLKSAGLAGIEAYYGNYSDEQVGELLRIAQKFDLISTGGSDFHGLDVASELPLGAVDVPLECARNLLAFSGRQTATNA